MDDICKNRNKVEMNLREVGGVCVVDSGRDAFLTKVCWRLQSERTDKQLTYLA